MGGEFAGRLQSRATKFGLSLPPASVEKLGAYVRLLERWNARINLTALRLKPLSDAALDRLLIEPLLAAGQIADSPSIWFDLGSGGGSPAIPLKILRPSLRLTMVESTAKKAAFLREAIRSLDLADTWVENVRFEQLAESPIAAGTAAVVTARAVHQGQALFKSAKGLLAPEGTLWIFRSAGPVQASSTFFRAVRSVPLATQAALDILVVS